MYKRLVGSVKVGVAATTISLMMLSGCMQSMATQDRPAPTKAGSNMFHLAWAVAFSPDGKIIAAGYGGIANELMDQGDNVIRLWDLEQSSSIAQVLSGHDNQITSLAFSPDGQILASASLDATVRLWSLNVSPLTSRILTTAPSTRTVVFSPDGHFLAAGGGEDQTVRLWDIREPSKGSIRLKGEQYSGQSLSFSPDGSKLAASEHSGVRIWSMENIARPPVVLLSEIGTVWAVAFSPDSRLLAEGGVGQMVRMWDIQQPTKPRVERILDGHQDTIRSLAFNPDGSMLASGSNDATIRLWHVQQPKMDALILRGHTSAIQSLAFSPDGSKLASVGGDGTIRIWNMQNTDAAPMLLDVP